MNIDQFNEELKKIGIILTVDQSDQLEQFYQYLIDQNQQMNLTSIVQKDQVYLKHFYDSLTLTKAIDLNKSLSLCDVGSGAGFPGVVLKIVFPSLHIILIDSLQKRVQFLNRVIQHLKLTDIEAIHVRMEDYARINREKFDIITSRAVAKTKILAEICIPALKIGGHLILMKGKNTDEVFNAQSIISKLNAKTEDIIEFKLPIENSDRTLIKIQKKEKTEQQYPRTMDKIKKTL